MNINPHTRVDFDQYQLEVQHRIEKVLNRLLPPSTSKLAQIMRYAVLEGGKRIRPLLVYATGNCLGLANTHLDSIAAAIECIHCFSLIHDDLPALDNDDYRRGKLTCHKAFTEASAILAGDALLTLAFQIIVEDPYLLPEQQSALIRLLTHLTGTQGMIGGQMLDISVLAATLTEAESEKINLLKTGALIRASILASTVIVKTDQKILGLLEQFADSLGLLFQIQDDLLDGEVPLERAKQQKVYLLDKCLRLLNQCHLPTHYLEAISNFIANRVQ